MANILVFEGHAIIMTSQLCRGSMKAAMDNTQVNGYG